MEKGWWRQEQEKWNKKKLEKTLNEIKKIEKYVEQQQELKLIVQDVTKVVVIVWFIVAAAVAWLQNFLNVANVFVVAAVILVWRTTCSLE